jgi:hypothetical protein
VWREQGISPFLFTNLADRIQLCVLPDPTRATSTGLFGLAPTGMLVSSVVRQSPSFNIIVHTRYRSFLLQCLPSRTLGSPEPFALWRGDFPQGPTLSAVLLLPPQNLTGVFLASILCFMHLVICLRLEVISIKIMIFLTKQRFAIISTTTHVYCQDNN